MGENLVLGLFLLIPVVTGGLLLVFGRRIKGSNQRAAWWWLLLGNVTVFIFLSSLLCLGGEIYYRFFYDTTDSLDYTLTSQAWYRRHFQKNTVNCRDNIEYALQIASGKRRITFVGDSFAVGIGVKNVDDRFATGEACV